MSTWAEVDVAIPNLAAAGRRLLYRGETGEALLATVRGDDPPRIHPIWVGIVAGSLCAFILRRPNAQTSSVMAASPFTRTSILRRRANTRPAATPTSSKQPTSAPRLPRTGTSRLTTPTSCSSSRSRRRLQARETTPTNGRLGTCPGLPRSDRPHPTAETLAVSPSRGAASAVPPCPGGAAPPPQPSARVGRRRGGCPPP
jgi:hypothetical protein